MQHPELPIFSFISALLVIIPLSCRWPTRNVAVLALMSWLFIANIIYAINSLIWAGNIQNSAPVWCDISQFFFFSFATITVLCSYLTSTATKIIIAVSYALPLCTLCICRHLERVSSSRKVSYDDARDRKLRTIIEIIVCFHLPMVFMALRMFPPSKVPNCSSCNVSC
jgi:pheromone a factor receptor